ncbi:TetR/AcrR family transcriptional regulator [Frankia sp. CNm7]|uniref:TetR/AcrR family transcriptional regulator n=1 Tax=Frankia nepalensis TaxID=1836974 RepID=A0A937UP62_9ACTN|nr:TetR/AcrR family transcriptional regulator [Frankia nepalensis]MBL7502041.1 TetR/AcrR family transcriptional regulator [Frankia nepalensis]MBL7511947.1 TetR/AcrR family transcriptional regulator [Frankia nepalensis]MBL7524280.1 TetR/AcrR family transcriptional regulator [Frankia nepalensis]MBL7630539.1 TetR/AcrR family transcriptional regulator [Frankia nepalensis]
MTETEVDRPGSRPGRDSPSGPAAPRRRGRPRGLTDRVRRDVFRTVREMLGTVGYEALRIEDVAAAAGVHKTTLYRQWSSKADLVRDVLVAAEAAALPRPDEGSWDEDLKQLCAGLVRVFNDPVTLALVKTRVTANDELLTAGLSELAARDMAFVVAPFRRAVARGEIAPDADPSMLAECLMSALITRICVTRMPVDQAFMDRLARLLRAAAGVGPAAAHPPA